MFRQLLIIDYLFSGANIFQKLKVVDHLVVFFVINEEVLSDQLFLIGVNHRQVVVYHNSLEDRYWEDSLDTETSVSILALLKKDVVKSFLTFEQLFAQTRKES